MNKETLLKSLNLAKSFLSNQDFVPILTHFCFDKKSILAYNDVQAIRLDFATDLHCAVPGQLLTKLLGTISRDEINFILKDNDLSISTGKMNVGKTKLPTLPPDTFVFDFPDYVKEYTTKITNIGMDFIRGIERCLISVANDPVTPEFMGLHWTLNNSELTILSSDRRSISKYNIIVDSKGTFSCLIIPKFFCERLVDLSKQFVKEGNTFSIYFSNKTVVAELSSECAIYTRTIQPTNQVNIEERLHKVVPNLSRIPFITPPTELAEVLDRAILLTSSTELNDTKFSKVEINGNMVNIATSSRMGIANDELEFSQSLGTFIFNVDPVLIKRALLVSDHMAWLPNLSLFRTSNNSFLHAIAHVTV